MICRSVLTTIAVSSLSAATIHVGPAETHGSVCNAVQAASPGDIIEIDAVIYSGDVCVINKQSLTLRGVGGRAAFDAAGTSAQGKAIWVIKSDNVVVENIEFYNATVPDHNGAGIRGEGKNLTIRNCYFHHNEMGILTAPGGGDILIEYSEFANNDY